MGLKIPGIALKTMRVDAEFTTAQMAEKVGVKSRKTIENWEAEASEPSFNQFLIYCSACGVNASELVADLMKAEE